MSDELLESIKNAVKKLHGIDLVLISTKIGYTAVSEDAVFMNKVFGHKLHDAGGRSPYVLTTFPHDLKEMMTNRIAGLYFDHQRDVPEIQYALLDIVDKEYSIREITASSKPEILGKKF